MYPRRRMLRHLLEGTPYTKYIIILAACMTMTGCSLLPVEQEALQPPLIQPEAEPFDVVEASRGNIETYLRGTANFVSANSATLSFKSRSGRLKSINVKVGEEVQAGDLLAELETDDLDLQVQLQKLSYERAMLLFKEAKTAGANSTELRLRQIDVKREQLQLEDMETKLAQSRLHAPISGIVTFTESMNTGEMVNAYQAMVTVSNPKDMQLTYVAADSKDLLPIESGMPVSLKYKGKDYKGKVLQSPSNAPPAGDEAKAERNAVTILIGMDEPPADVQIGHSADLSIRLQSRENVLLLPRSAIRSYMGRSYVQIADGERRKEVDVELGLTTPTQVEIVNGLEEGQQVILNNG